MATSWMQKPSSVDCVFAIQGEMGRTEKYPFRTQSLMAMKQQLV